MGGVTTAPGVVSTFEEFHFSWESWVRFLRPLHLPIAFGTFSEIKNKKKGNVKYQLRGNISPVKFKCASLFHISH